MTGFSLIEMMISITIGLFIIAGLIGLLISSSGSSKTNDRTAELQENGRYALDHLGAKLREAGYRGYTAQAPESGSWSALGITTGCGTPELFVKNIRQAVWGSNDSNPFAANCIPTASYSTGSDILVTRSAASTPELQASTATHPNTVYLQSSYSSAKLFLGSAIPADANGTINFALQEYVYYISPFTNSATENPKVPALYRVALQPDAVGVGMTPELVVTGIEQLQVQYGMSYVDGTTKFFNADGVSVGDHSATGQTNWDKISSVRIWLLARSTKADIDFNVNNQNTNYDIGDHSAANGNPYVTNDHFRRLVFTSVIQLRNFRN
jgi:type IV pilus assembly protein PilW